MSLRTSVSGTIKRARRLAQHLRKEWDECIWKRSKIRLINYTRHTYAVVNRETWRPGNHSRGCHAMTSGEHTRHTTARCANNVKTTIFEGPHKTRRWPWISKTMWLWGHCIQPGAAWAQHDQQKGGKSCRGVRHGAIVRPFLTASILHIVQEDISRVSYCALHLF